MTVADWRAGWPGVPQARGSFLGSRDALRCSVGLRERVDPLPGGDDRVGPWPGGLDFSGGGILDPGVGRGGRR